MSCEDCIYFKPIGKGRILSDGKLHWLSGWCKDNREGRKSIRVNSFDHCDFAVKKEAETR